VRKGSRAIEVDDEVLHMLTRFGRTPNETLRGILNIDRPRKHGNPWTTCACGHIAQDHNKLPPATELIAKTAIGARREVRERWPQGGDITGYTAEDETVYMTSVRAVGDKAHVATVTKNRAPPAVRFVGKPNPPLDGSPQWGCDRCDCRGYTGDRKEGA